jgi:hypothetical protein
MAIKKKPSTKLLGTGMARKAAEAAKARNKQIEEVAEATGFKKKKKY